MSRYPDAIRDAAIADYYASGDDAQDVAARHGIPRSTFGKWVNQSHVPEPEVDPFEYVGGWINDRGIMRPLYPERRTA